MRERMLGQEIQLQVPPFKKQGGRSLKHVNDRLYKIILLAA